MSRTNRGNRKDHGGQWNGIERRAEPRTPKRNMGRAKFLIMLVALGITIASWIGLATMHLYQDPHTPLAPTGVVSPISSFYLLLGDSEPGFELGE